MSTSQGFRHHTFVVPIIFGNQRIISASYAVSASYSDYAENANYANTASYAFYAVSASHAEQSDTASYSFYAVSASHADNADYSISSSHALNADYSISSSHALDADYSISSSHAIMADTASYIDERLDRYDGGSGNYTSIPDHKFGLVELSPDTDRTVTLNDSYAANEYFSIINTTGNTLTFTPAGGVKLFSDGATIAGNDGKLTNKRSNTTVTCLFNGTDWELVGKLSN